MTEQSWAKWRVFFLFRFGPTYHYMRIAKGGYEYTLLEILQNARTCEHYEEHLKVSPFAVRRGAPGKVNITITFKDKAELTIRSLSHKQLQTDCILCRGIPCVEDKQQSVCPDGDIIDEECEGGPNVDSSQEESCLSLTDRIKLKVRSIASQDKDILKPDTADVNSPKIGAATDCDPKETSPRSKSPRSRELKKSPSEEHT